MRKKLTGELPDEHAVCLEERVVEGALVARAVDRRHLIGPPGKLFRLVRECFLII